MSFFKTFLKNPSQVWSIVPSSRFLVNSMLSQVDFKESKLILELWVWIWNISSQILYKMWEDSKLVWFELDSKLIEKCSFSDNDRFSLINDSAENISNYIDSKADCIISGLPFASLPNEVWDKIINEVYANLKTGWSFVQFQYFLTDKKRFDRVFWKANISFQALNIPPAFIYRYTKND